MEKKIEEAVLHNGMEAIYEGAILGFSGGADSSALLHYLKDKCHHLLAVHINHMIRGEEAVRDREHCRKKCLEYGVKFISFDIDIPKLSAERKKGLEEVAREERYRVFYDLLEKSPQYKAIITAHNSNDNAETVIFNLTRGAGAKGISGIKPVQGKVYRPLILATRDEILDYCHKNGIEYVTDSTNLCDDYTRNNIRHNILPRLTEINPSFLDACVRLGEILRQDEEYINKRANEIILTNDIKNEAPLELLTSLDTAVLTRVLSHMSGGLDYKSTKACCQLIQKGGTGKRINLPNGISFKLEYGYAAFLPNSDLEPCEFFSYIDNGVNKIEGTELTVTVNAWLTDEGYAKIGSVRLNSKQIFGKLYVRQRKNGDTVKSGGVTKKLKRVFCDKHIPWHMRDKMPIVCDDIGIVAVPSVVARDGAFDKKGDIEIAAYIKK